MQKILGYERHPIADSFPMLEGTAWDLFLEDVKAQGLIDNTLWLYKGKLLDGSNRGRGAEILKLKVKFKEYEGDDPIGFVVSRNLQRRHLNESQRAMVAARLATLQVGQKSKSGLKSQAAADALNVGRSTVFAAKAVLEQAVPELVAAVDRGDVAVTRAAELAKLEPDEQRKRLKADLAGESKPASSRPRAQNDEQLQLSPKAASKQLMRTVVKSLEQLGATIQDLATEQSRTRHATLKLAYGGVIFKLALDSNEAEDEAAA